MKKIVLTLGVVFCILLTSCGGGQKKVQEQTKDECCKTEQKCQMTEEQKAECEAFKAQWDNWDNLDDATKTNLIAKAKACIDKKAEGCKNHGEKECCKGKEGEGCKNHGEKEGCKGKEGEGCKNHGEKEGCKNKEGEGCKNHGEKECCKGKEGEPKAELTAEQKAECEAKKIECEKKMAEMKAKWEAFETLNLEEQKELIDMHMKMMSCKKHQHGGEGCKAHEGCKGHENHEGCKGEKKEGECKNAGK